MSSSSSADYSVCWEKCSIGLNHFECARISFVRATQEPSLMSIWSTSTGRNSVFGAEDGAVLPSSHLPIHVARTHLRNIDGHCFHKRFHECQHPLGFCPTQDFWQVLPLAPTLPSTFVKDVTVRRWPSHAGLSLLEKITTQPSET
ncbi:uncharacterized protein LOC100870443 isoform X2 [Apis florea]|uniref:uncharacterized protein LOC100870443 isoform X2 n=1 Tax=Apis florea TaxID=7463 RepID=UPI00062981F3|nr:uncharacterized protein LOC100870443 isoform X2 [Apis florea]